MGRFTSRPATTPPPAVGGSTTSARAASYTTISDLWRRQPSIKSSADCAVAAGASGVSSSDAE